MVAARDHRLLLVPLLACAAAEMNAGGVPYGISNPDLTSPTAYRTDFSDKPTFGEFFDVYGRVETQYSQVNAPYDLPKELVMRFKGKVMAITGYEIDQVMTDDPRSKVNTHDNDRSVPIYNAYNHHYFSWLTGEDSELVDLDEPTLLPNPTWTGVRTRAARKGKSGYPSSIVFKENPGGEFRKSYHGYPAGTAQLLYSPTQWVVEPMQIDTHNRRFNATDDTAGFQRWFLPKQDDMSTGYNDRASHLSPLIECPCSDRINKTITHEAVVLAQSPGCAAGAALANLSACRSAVAAVARVSAARRVENASLPAGCLAVPDAPSAAPSYTAVFNTAAKPAAGATCDGGGSDAFTWSARRVGFKIDCAKAGCVPPAAEHGCEDWQGQCAWSSAAAARGNCSKWASCRGFYCSTHYHNGQLRCFARSTADAAPSAHTDDYVETKVSPLALAGSTTAGGAHPVGAAALVNVSIAHDGLNKTTITLSGPAGAWFGVGFAATKMADAPYAIVVDGKGVVTERRLADHGPGAQLAPSVAVTAHSVSGGRREVVLTRGVTGASSQHWSLPTAPGVVQLITATGTGADLAYHGPTRTGASLTLLPVRTSACVCEPTHTQTLTYMDTTSMQFSVSCAPEPRGDMQQQHNPACNLETYHGGLRCCKHTWFLTDRAQAPVAENTTSDVYYLKFRYYFQEYVPPKPKATPPVPASHKHLHHWVFLIDAQVNDYEEVQCKDDHDGQTANHSNCIGRITAHLPASQMGLEDVPPHYDTITPFVMTPHCHAPSCIREELWDADTNRIICNVSARYGTGNNTFNESDYAAIPPCLWGSQAGLSAPPAIKPGTNLRAVKYFNTSFRHLGQMAQWTGLMVYDTDPFKAELDNFA
eukprot:g1435.t1